jgi:HD-GYP domain-containing protein (c-di-GMP phosphodiesterase class II)
MNDPHIATAYTASTPATLGVGAERLQALQAFNARLVCMTVDDASYHEIVRGISRVTGCDACALFLHDAAGQRLDLKASIGYDDIPAGLGVSVNDPVSAHAHAFREEYLVHADNMADEQDMQVLSATMGSVLVLPVISNRGPVGVFEFASREQGAFGQQDIGLCSMAVDQMAYSLENIRLVGDLSRTRDAVIRGMALLAEIRDADIGGHLSRICEYSRRLALSLQGRMGYHEVTAEFVDALSRSAALHDVGKVGIPDSILLKPGKLTTEEYAVMKSHTTMGANLLQGLMDDFGEYTLITMGSEVARAHHEWWDGTGYPLGLAGRNIPLAARIVAIADVYDALTSRRVYKDAWNRDDAVTALRKKAGTQFDPELVGIFTGDTDALDAVRALYPD